LWPTNDYSSANFKSASDKKLRPKMRFRLFQRQK
jgi:hypothetical protein